MVGTWVSILPPLIALTMVLITRRVLISLGAGIIAAGVILASFSPGQSAKNIFEAVLSPFWVDSSANTSSINLLIFIFLLGFLTAFISLSGGNQAFAVWAVKRVKTKRGAKLLTVILGVLIFVDDYFNALAVGQIARPITDSHKISRAKLAYFIDSTAAPICVVSPVSSWGAFLIGQLTIIFGGAAVIAYSPFQAFVLMAPMNFYVISTLMLVFFLALTDYDFFTMRKHEHLAAEKGLLFDPSKEVSGELEADFPQHQHGKVIDLVAPIITLVLVTLVMIVITGYIEAGSYQILAIFENTDVPFSLVIGGAIAVILSIYLYLRKRKYNETFSGVLISRAIYSGLQTMLPAAMILIFAWALSFLIEDLATGAYLAGIVEQFNIQAVYLPLIIFILSAIMAFATGTSWGTFGILLPIAGSIMISADPDLILPALAAVLAGAVFGDHCSPISDTTILSATGAGSNLMDHVITQLPYALISAVLAGLGYFVLGLTHSIWLGLLTVIVLTLLLFGLIIIRTRQKHLSRA